MLAAGGAISKMDRDIRDGGRSQRQRKTGLSESTEHILLKNRSVRREEMA
jgi:hypothetical protein